MSMRQGGIAVKRWNEEVRARRVKPCTSCGHEPELVEAGHMVKLRPDTASHYGEIRCAMCDGHLGFLAKPPREHTAAWARYYEAEREGRRGASTKQGVLL